MRQKLLLFVSAVDAAMAVAAYRRGQVGATILLGVLSVLCFLQARMYEENNDDETKTS